MFLVGDGIFTVIVLPRLYFCDLHSSAWSKDLALTTIRIIQVRSSRSTILSQWIYPAWVTFNNLLLLLVLIAAAICSLIFLYAWVSVSVHGGGEMMPLTCTVWHGRLGTLAIAHHHSSEVRTTLLLIFMFQFQYRLIIDSRRICLKLSFFSIFFGFETCLSSWGGGVRCPRWPGEPTALSGVFPLVLPGSYLIGIPIGDPVGSGCLSLSLAVLSPSTQR